MRIEAVASVRLDQQIGLDGVSLAKLIFLCVWKTRIVLIGCWEARQPGGKSNANGHVLAHAVTVFGDQGSSAEEFLSLQRPSPSRPSCSRNRINLRPDSMASGERGNSNTNPSGGLAAR
jgi:hypothetical protein